MVIDAKQDSSWWLYLQYTNNQSLSRTPETWNIMASTIPEFKEKEKNDELLWPKVETKEVNEETA